MNFLDTPGNRFPYDNLTSGGTRVKAAQHFRTNGVFNSFVEKYVEIPPKKSVPRLKYSA